jgi:hypothetical protein
MKRLVWVAGKHTGSMDFGSGEAWELMGVFTTEAKAASACTEWTHFIGPVILDARFPDETTPWIGLYFPLAVKCHEWGELP